MAELIKLSAAKHQELQSFLYDRFLELKAQRDNYDDEVTQWVANYNFVTDKSKDTGREHNYFVPQTYAIIKGIFPRLYFSMFGNLSWLKVQAERSDWVGKENQMSTYMQRVLDKIGFKKKMYTAIKRAMIYPHTIVKELFDLEQNLPTIDIVDYFDYWQDIAYQTIEEAPDCFNRIVRSKSQIGLKFKSGKYYPHVKEKWDKTTIDLDLMSKQATVMNYFLASGKEIIVTKEGSTTEKAALMNTEILEWYGAYDIDDSGKNTYIVATMLNRSCLVRVIVNEEGRKKPFRKISVSDEPVGFYSKSYTQVLEPLQYMLNDIVNYRYDNIALMINKVFKLRRNSVVDYSTIFAGSGNVIELDDLTDLEEMKFDNVIQDSYLQENSIRQDMQQISGMIDFGNTPEMLKGVGATATGLSLLTSEAVSKYREPLDVMRENITDIIQDVFYMLHKHSDKIAFRTAKSYDTYDVYQLKPEDFKHEYYFSIQMKNFMPNKQLVLQNLVTLLNIVGNVPGVNVIAYLKNIFDLMDEIKNPEEVLPALRQQSQKAIDEAREQQKTDKEKKGLEDTTVIAAGGSVPTPEEQLINMDQSGIMAKPLNPQASNDDVTNMTSIQDILGG